jgi:hypothetical protein
MNTLGRRESGLDRLDSVSVRGDDFVKDRRPPISAFTRVFDALWAAALRAVLDKIITTNKSASKRSRPHCDAVRMYSCFIFGIMA